MSTKTNPEKRKKHLSGIALVLVGLLLWMFGCAGVTPSSVFVSGYYRSDGTYVGSYNRRPPGSVPHDSPFETAEWLGFFFVCFGVYVLVSKDSARNTPTASYRRFPAPTPEVPDAIELVPVPTHRGVAESNWRCERCDRPFGEGTPYWFNGCSIQSDTSRYCSLCRDELVLANRRTLKGKTAADS